MLKLRKEHLDAFEAQAVPADGVDVVLPGVDGPDLVAGSAEIEDARGRRFALQVLPQPATQTAGNALRQFSSAAAGCSGGLCAWR